MKTFLYLFYQFSKYLVLTIFKVFYSKKIILNRKNLRIENPCILVSNHPNTLHDPLHVATNVENRVVHFLINSGLYATAIGNWFFSTFYCIKIERPKDVEGRKVSNEKSFETCDQFLAQGGSLYIAPEGTSKIERHIRKIKTGAARIALSAESKNDFKLGVTILPVGLNYSNTINFREKILLNVGEPISIAKYKEVYKADSFEAAQKVTEDIAHALGNLIINTKDEKEENLLADIETIYESDEALEIDKQFFRSKKLLVKLRKMKEVQPDNFAALASLLKNYNAGLAALTTDDYSLTQIDRKLKPSSYFLYLLGAFPFIWGWANNFLAYYTPAWLNRKLNIYIGYSSTVKSLVGVITVPLFYGMQTALVYYFTQNWYWTSAYFFSLIPLGLFAWKYYLNLEKDRSIFQLKKRRRNTIVQVKELLKMRSQIKTLLKSSFASS